MELVGLKEIILDFFKELKKELPNECKKHSFDLINIFYTITFMLLWVFYILDPILKTLDKYALVDKPDPVIVLSLAGFLMLSMWFILTQFSFYCTRWTLMIYRGIKRIIKFIGGSK